MKALAVMFSFVGIICQVIAIYEMRTTQESELNHKRLLYFEWVIASAFVIAFALLAFIQ